VKNWKTIIFGGRIDDLKADADSQHGVVIPPIIFQKGAWQKFALAAVLIVLSPLVMIPSKFGVIPYKYPEGFLESTLLCQYLQALGYNFLVIIKSISSGEGFLPSVPTPIGTGWQVLVSLALLILYALTVSLLIGSWKIISENYNLYKRRC